jgi:5-methylcytosine-specific restriction endonuclease McrA
MSGSGTYKSRAQRRRQRLGGSQGKHLARVLGPLHVRVVTPKPPTAVPYADYLKTHHWRALRTKVLARWSGMCENCGSARAAHVHHKTYERLGRELLSDLTPLCADCHAAEHGTGVKEGPPEGGPRHITMFPTERIEV